MATRRLEKLYSKTGKEQVTEWIIQIVDIEDDLFTEFRVEMYSGLFGRALNNKPDSFLVKTGKNIGKSNETTPLEQAINEAKAKWQHKIDREGYISLKQKGLTDEQRKSITKNEIYALLPKHKAFVDGYFKPQKAYNIKDVDVKKLNFPMYIQPKLNGVRCVGTAKDENVFLTSKNGLDYNIQHIKDDLKELYKVLGKHYVLDGELYIHDEILSEILSCVKKENLKTKNLKFCIFDLSIEEKNQHQRFEVLEKINRVIKQKNLQNIQIVTTYMVLSIEIALRETKVCIGKGYEGAILRNPKSLYQFGKRTKDMIKIKEYSDGEFKILDVVPHNKDTTIGSLYCLNDINTLKFTVEIEATTEKKQEMLLNKKNYIGKKATVLYYERTINGLPFHAKAISIRDYEG